MSSFLFFKILNDQTTLSGDDLTTISAERLAIFKKMAPSIATQASLDSESSIAYIKRMPLISALLNKTISQNNSICWKE